LGSGNTIIAAANLNMSAFGFDLSETYKNKFISRVQQWNPPEKKEISHE
jgi:DNA modification methylase